MANSISFINSTHGKGLWSSSCCWAGMWGRPFPLHKLMGSFTTARCPETHYLCCKVHLDWITLLTFLPIQALLLLFSCPVKRLEMFSGLLFASPWKGDFKKNLNNLAACKRGKKNLNTGWQELPDPCLAPLHAGCAWPQCDEAPSLGCCHDALIWGDAAVRSRALCASQEPGWGEQLSPKCLDVGTQVHAPGKAFPGV